jgi:hypothetical protein
MITDAIQSILEPIVNSFSPIINSDKAPRGISVVHSEEFDGELRDKEGVYGYEYNLTVTVIGDSQDDVDPMVDQVIDALEESIGEFAGITIEEVITQSSKGVAWDDDKKKYFDEVIFYVQTKNR